MARANLVGQASSASGQTSARTVLVLVASLSVMLRQPPLHGWRLWSANGKEKRGIGAGTAAIKMGADDVKIP